MKLACIPCTAMLLVLTCTPVMAMPGDGMQIAERLQPDHEALLAERPQQTPGAAGQGNPPAHAGEQGRPEHSRQPGRPEHSQESGRPEDPDEDDADDDREQRPRPDNEQD